MQKGLMYMLVVVPWLLFTAWAMVTFSAWWGFLLIIPMCATTKSDD